jgi:hypothetical protein
LNTPSNQQSNEPRLGLSRERWSRIGHRAATVGFLLFAAFAPHSIASAEISLAVVGAGWLLRTIASGRSGFRRTLFDVPILLFLLWTATSSLLSEEPRISIAKLQSNIVIFVFYLAQAVVTRRTAIVLVVVMILSGVAGTIFSIVDLARGRGVVVESIASDSPFQSSNVHPGDAIWRIGNERVFSVAGIDEAIRQ